MKKFRVCLPLIFAVSLAGCGVTGSVNDGAGYALLTPSPATRNFIVTTDASFAAQVAGHNAQCRRDKLCKK